MAATPVWRVDADAPDPAVIARAADLLRAGRLIAFPTETVYGLGANALDAAAVGRIFTAKGRPATNPVIVHVADPADARGLVTEWPDEADKLAAAFWPGPLTLVLPKAANVPDVVTAGGPSVAVRCPRHGVAAALIRAAGVPVAAPSANRSTELSPTRAEHVAKVLDGRIDAILDGGPCVGGLESTVVSVVGGVRVLRPGLITVPMLEAIVGPIVPTTGLAVTPTASPGQLPTHYSPRTPLRLVTCDELRPSERVAVLPAGDNPTAYAATLYHTLHAIDAGDYDEVLAELPPDTPEWAAARDRLRRAATTTP